MQVPRRAEPDAWAPLRPLVLAVWFGLLAGMLELAVLGVWKFLLGRRLFVSPHILWMAPLADLLLLAAPALVLAVLAWRWPGLGALRLATAVCALLGFWSVLLMFQPRLHKYAGLALAAGLAFQASRLAAAHARGFHSLVRRTLGGLVGLVAVLGVGVFAWERIVEARAVASLPHAAPGAPNVLLIVLDTVRAQSLSLYGYGRSTTPELERWATTAVRFERAIATAPWTLPSHASMFTGRYPHELSASWTAPLDGRYPTLAEFLSAAGYATAGFCANTRQCSAESGLARGFVHWEDYVLSPGQILASSSLGGFLASSPTLRRLIGYYDLPGRKTAARLNSDFLGWLARSERRPFFAFLNYFDAHAPYVPPRSYIARFGPAKPRRHPLLLPDPTWPADEVQAELDAYEGAIAWLDRELGRLLGELGRRGVLANTLVIVTSDHGEEFGEHRLFEHGNSLYLPALVVPLLVSFPQRVPAGRVVREPVSLRGLPATVAELVKLQGAPFPGRSLSRYWDGPRDPRAAPEPLLSELGFTPNKPAWFPTSKGDMKSVVVGHHHYIRNGDGLEELYDIDSDPREQHNLAGSEDARELLVRLRQMLQRMVGEGKPPGRRLVDSGRVR